MTRDDMRHRRLGLTVAALASFYVLVCADMAQANEVAPLVPQIQPERADEILVRFHDALAEGAKQSGAGVVSAAQIRQKLGSPIAEKACVKGRCLSAQLPGLGAKNALTARIDIVGKNYTIEVTLSPSSISESARCDVCTLAEALSTTRRLAKIVCQRLEKKPGLTGARNPATHGPKPEAKRPTGSAPGEDKLRQTDGNRPWPLWPALAAAGVGVLGLAVGIPLVSINGDFTNCDGAARPDGRNCQDQYSTSGVGWTMTSMGIAGLATSGVFLYLYFTSDKRKTASRPSSILRSVSIAPTPGGVYFGAGGRF